MNSEKNARNQSLDLLRGFAALSVAISHFFLRQEGGNSIAEHVSIISVELFFILSGFVLAPQIMACVLQDGFAANIKVFMIRRWMRTVPPYLVTLICATLAFKDATLGDFLLYAVYAQNLFAQHMTRDYFFVAWSLSVEEWFYVVFPTALFLVHHRIFKGRDFVFGARLVLSALFIVLVIVALRYFAADQAHWGESVRRVVVFRIDSIAYGFLAYMFLPHFRKVPVVLLGVGAGGFFILSLYIAERIALQDPEVWKNGFLYAAAGFGICAVSFFYRSDAWLAGGRLYARICSVLGGASYSVYLFHSIILLFMPMHTDGGDYPILVLYTLLVIGFAYLFYRVFERPILARRPKFRFDIKQL